MEVVFIDQTRASFEDMLRSIIDERLNISAQKRNAFSNAVNLQMQSSTSPFLPGVLYSLKDTEVIRKLGFGMLSHPTRKILNELQKHGIEVETRQKTGSVAFGTALNHYLQIRRKNQKLYTQKQ